MSTGVLFHIRRCHSSVGRAFGDPKVVLGGAEHLPCVNHAFEPLKGLRHEDFAGLAQFCDKIIT